MTDLETLPHGRGSVGPGTCFVCKRTGVMMPDMVILVDCAVSLKHYFWAAGFLVVAIVFSPLALTVKVLFLMGLTLLAAFQVRKRGVHPCHLDFT